MEPVDHAFQKGRLIVPARQYHAGSPPKRYENVD